MMERIECLAAVLLVLLLIWIIWRRQKCIRKIRRMSRQEKVKLLNELTIPFGFEYNLCQDVFVSRIDAWQRKEGYEGLFDRLAPKFNMIMDSFPVYFDYGNKTWLIEFWKGQYGINTGAEAGVYHANRPIPKKQREKVHYNAASNEEMPLIGICLKRKRESLFSLKSYHWWLAAFRMGTFSNPADLVMHASITFHHCEAAQAFCEGLQEAGFERNQYRIRNRRVTVRIDQTQNYCGSEKLYRRVVQGFNRFYCRLYQAATRPFTATPDRMLFLYEQLPWCFRRMLRLHSFGRKVRVKT